MWQTGAGSQRWLGGADGPAGGLLRQLHRRRPSVGGVDSRHVEAEGYEV